MLENLQGSLNGGNLEAVYGGLTSNILHFYRAVTTFPDFGEPTVDIVHQNAFMKEISEEDWRKRRLDVLKIEPHQFKNYQVKSISCKFNERMTTLIKAIVQHFNSKTYHVSHAQPENNPADVPVRDRQFGSNPFAGSAGRLHPE